MENIEIKSKEYAASKSGLNHRKTAARDFMEGYKYATQWIDAKSNPPEVGRRVLVKCSGTFVNTGMLRYNSEIKKYEWICGNSNRAWDIDFWLPLPE